MIAKLIGLLDSVGEDWAILDVHGVGYLLSCSTRTLAKLPQPGGSVTLYCETRLKDELPQLFGFGDRAEQDWFRLLTTVQGVGGRVALAILSVLAPDNLAMAIAAGDRAALSRADGVGPKLAVRIVTELKDKAQTVSLKVAVGQAAGTAAPAAMSANAEAVSALVNLGYSRADAFAAVARVPDGADLPLGDLIRRALRELGNAAGGGR